jgi:hypothetical protein
MLIPPNITNFLLNERNYIEPISDTPLKVQFPRKTYIEFWVGIGGDFPHFSRKALKRPAFNTLPVRD